LTLAKGWSVQDDFKIHLNDATLGAQRINGVRLDRFLSILERIVTYDRHLLFSVPLDVASIPQPLS